MNLLLIALLVQSSLTLPPRVAMENPAAVSEIPRKVQKDYDKAWSRFIAGKEDPKLAKDLDKLLKKQKDFDAVVLLGAYLDLYQGKDAQATEKLERIFSHSPENRIALYYLGELAFARSDYSRAGDFYAKLREVDKNRFDLEAKQQKALLLATEDVLRSAARAEEQNLLSDAEKFYRRALGIAPQEPTFHARLAELLGKENKWEEALTHYRRQLELSGQNSEAEKKIAEALMHLGRTEEARDLLDRLRKEGSVDETLEAKVKELEDLGRWGKDIEYFHQIEAAESITREQVAALMVRYFPQLTEFRQNPEIITDIQTSWARPEIQTIVGIGLISSLPNHTFQPSKPMTWGDLAVSMARLIGVLNLSSNDAPQAPLADFASTNARYLEIKLVLGYGLMSPDHGGNFDINAEVSGEAAIRAVQRLLELFREKAG